MQFKITKLIVPDILESEIRSYLGNPKIPVAVYKQGDTYLLDIQADLDQKQIESINQVVEDHKVPEPFDIKPAVDNLKIMILALSSKWVDMTDEEQDAEVLKIIAFVKSNTEG